MGAAMAAPGFDGFSYSTFTLRTVCAQIAHEDYAAPFAARTASVEEQPGRERPHPRTPDPDPSAGSGVAHVPAAGDWTPSKSPTEMHIACTAIHRENSAHVCQYSRTSTSVEQRHAANAIFCEDLFAIRIPND